MKKTKIEKKLDRIEKIVEQAFEECDCENVVFSYSTMVLGSEPAIVMDAVANNIHVEVVISRKWNGHVAVQFKKNKAIVVPIMNLIDAIQIKKDQKK